jgi:hypothetical protein
VAFFMSKQELTMPRGIPNNKAISSSEQSIGQTASLDMPTTGPLAGMVRPDQEIVIADGPMLGDYAAELAFNEEPVKVIVHESTDENAEPLVDVYCNGTPQRFLRGQEQTVKRKFVEILARARQTSIKTTVATNGDETVNRINRHTAVRYPFSVLEDRNPKGGAWLKQVLASAV